MGKNDREFVGTRVPACESRVKVLAKPPWGTANMLLSGGSGNEAVGDGMTLAESGVRRLVG